MKKHLVFLLVATLVSLAVCAQKNDNDNKTLSLGAELAFPGGDLSTGNNTGFGVSAKAAFPVVTDGAVTASLGFISFGGKSNLGTNAWNMIPVKAGFRYNIGGSGFNVEPQLGYTFGSYSGASASNVSGFIWAIGAGYFFTPQIDLSARFESVKVTNGNANFVGIRLAYNFSLGGK